MQYTFSSQVNFLPFVGENYGKDGMPKVLFLGESHYGAVEPRDGTRNVVQNYAYRDSRTQFFKRLLKILYGESDNPEMKYSFVALYNYVQECVGDTSFERPKENMWKDSEPAFIEVIDTLKPDIIICGGRRLSWAIQNHEYATIHICETNYSEKPWWAHYKYNLRGSDINVFAVYHPAYREITKNIGWLAVYHHVLIQHHPILSTLPK
jgi:hypothetical protein